MKEGHFRLDSVEVELLMSMIKVHLRELHLILIHEENKEGYWSLKVHKGGKVSAITRSPRDVDIVMSGSCNDYKLTLKTGAWVGNIAVPSMLAGMASYPCRVFPAHVPCAIPPVLAGLVSLTAGAAVAGAETYRAHRFEKNFWLWLDNAVRSLQ